MQETGTIQTKSKPYTAVIGKHKQNISRPSATVANRNRFSLIQQKSKWHQTVPDDTYENLQRLPLSSLDTAGLFPERKLWTDETKATLKDQKWDLDVYSTNAYTVNKPLTDDLVSVVVPTHNSEKFVVETLESVRQQARHANVELLVVDDGSKKLSS